MGYFYAGGLNADVCHLPKAGRRQMMQHGDISVSADRSWLRQRWNGYSGIAKRKKRKQVSQTHGYSGLLPALL